MAKYSLAVVAGETSAGVLEFLLLVDSSETGRGGHSEDLQDLECRIAERFCYEDWRNDLVFRVEILVLTVPRRKFSFRNRSISSVCRNTRFGRERVLRLVNGRLH